MPRFTLTIAMLALAVTRFAQATPSEARVRATKLLPITVMTKAGKRALRVEVARTAEEQARGLMFRTYIAPNGGMLFPFDPPRVASFWMKNCPIPEDMIFIRADGTIARIEAHTVPYSETPVGSGEPVVAVLELAGGRAAQLGIAENDRVKW